MKVLLLKVEILLGTTIILIQGIRVKVSLGLSHGKKVEICFYCQKGHLIKDYFNRKGEEEGKTSIESANSAVAFEKTDIDDVLATSIEAYDQEWILDSGSTYHMCPVKDWFSNLKKRS